MASGDASHSKVSACVENFSLTDSNYVVFRGPLWIAACQVMAEGPRVFRSSSINRRNILKSFKMRGFTPGCARTKPMPEQKVHTSPEEDHLRDGFDQFRWFHTQRT